MGDEKTADSIDDKVNAIFERAVKRGEIDGEFALFEHEVFDILKILGLDTVNYQFYENPTTAALDSANYESDSEYVVIALQGKYLEHKTDVGAVEVKVPKDKIEETVQRMLARYPLEYAEWAKHHKDSVPTAYKGLVEHQADLAVAAQEDLQGVLIMDYYEHRAGVFDEIQIGMEDDEDVGPILMYGVGGTRSDSMISSPKSKDDYFTIKSLGLLDNSEISAMLEEPQVLHANLPGRGRGDRGPDKVKELESTMAILSDFFKKYSSLNSDADYNIASFEVNPFSLSPRIRPLDGILKFKIADKTEYPERPYQKLGKVVNPGSVLIAGASTDYEKNLAAEKVLIKLLECNFPREQIYIFNFKPDKLRTKLNDIYSGRFGELPKSMFFGSLEDIQEERRGEKIDLVYNGLPASDTDRFMGFVKAAGNVVDAMFTITPGFGETEDGAEIEKELEAFFRDSEMIHVGANTLGNIYVSPDGRIIDTMFEPPTYKAPKIRNVSQNLKVVCQSGARAVALRRALENEIMPSVLLTTGNCTDMKASHALKWLSEDHGDANVYAFYVESFKNDGLEFALTARELSKQGKDIILYKAGRTPEGSRATQTHTGKAAGPYDRIVATMNQAAVYIAESEEEFKTMMLMKERLSRSPIDYGKLPNIGAIANAGYEKCGIADNVRVLGERMLSLEGLTPETTKKIKEVLVENNVTFIDQDKGDVIDVSPLLGDAAYSQVMKYILEDENCHAAVLSVVADTGALNTLEPGEGHDENIYDLDKPCIFREFIKIAEEYGDKKAIVYSVNEGEAFDPGVQMMKDNGLVVFRNVDKATKMLGKHVRHEYNKTQLSKIVLAN